MLFILSLLRSLRKEVGAMLGCALKHSKSSVLVKGRKETGGLCKLLSRRQPEEGTVSLL